MQIAENFISSGQRKNALIIGAEKLSSMVDWEDRNTCVLFGDGAGAAILTTDEEIERERNVILQEIAMSNQHQAIETGHLLKAILMVSKSLASPGSSGVEQRTENPRVGGSNPPPGTIKHHNTLINLQN